MIMGVGFIILGIFFIFIAISLWKGKNWARYLISVLAIIGLISSVLGIIRNFSDIISLVQNFISLIINGLIAWYLMRKDIKEQFH